MSDQIVMAIIGSATTITLAYIAYRTAQNGKQAVLNGQQAAATHLLVNSRMTELLELTRSSSKAEGVKEEKEKGA